MAKPKFTINDMIVNVESFAGIGIPESISKEIVSVLKKYKEIDNLVNYEYSLKSDDKLRQIRDITKQ